MRNRDKSFKNREKGAKIRDECMQNRENGTKNRARKDRSSAAAGADSVFWAEHNYDSSRTGYFSYALTPTLRCSTGTHAYSRVLEATLRSYLHPLPQVLHAPATALDQVRSERILREYSRVLSGTLGSSRGAGHALACGLFLYFVTHGYSRGLTRAHGELTGYSV